MHRHLLRVGVAISVLTASVTAQQPGPTADVEALIARVGERVERFFARAQSLVCLESVNWQPLSMSFSSEGFGRHVQSELRLSWDPAGEDGPSTEARTLRQVLKVNGRPPRENDRDNCTTPEQNETETQPLSILLPSQRGEYRFSVAGETTLDGRRAVMLDFREIKEPTVLVEMVEGNDNCVSFDIKGGSLGRLWVDAETLDVLRLDQHMRGYIEIPMPEKARRFLAPRYWTMERMDSTTRFKAVAFENPDETLVLPVSVTSLRVTRGSGTPRLRTTTEYSSYKRFLTGGRIVPQ